MGGGSHHVCCAAGFGLSTRSTRLSIQYWWGIFLRADSLWQKEKARIMQDTERKKKRKKETTRLLDDGGAPHFRERLIVRGRYKTLCATAAEMEWRVNPLSCIISDFKLMAIVTTTD